MKAIKLLVTIMVLGLINVTCMYSVFAGPTFIEKTDNNPETYKQMVFVTNLELDDEPNFESYSNNPQLLSSDWMMFGHDEAHTRNSTSKVPINDTIFWSAVGSESSSPAIAYGLVFCGSSNFLECYYESNGTLNWRNNIGSSGAGVVASPAVADNKVYIGSGTGASDTMYCFWINNGSTVWTYPTGSSYTSPAVSNGTVYFGSQAGDLYSLSANNGALDWSVPLGVTHSSPAVMNNK
ncbi:MAG: PQQ-like beta-propeller repeat protein, partial [Thermoplasmata archaeon]|nr:PQQ-like beta-propeller repeat protein [Thermoplasmata archaeon]